jgi:integrase
LVRATGARPIRLHDLRHLHATLALEDGVAHRVVADRLGHSSTAVTTDIYQHVLPHLEHDAALRVAVLVFGQRVERQIERGRT